MFVCVFVFACSLPMLCIAHNCSCYTVSIHSQVIVQKLLGLPFEMGYNAMDDTIVDMLAAGVIDPAKVTKNGLLNSCSIAGIMLTTQVRLIDCV